MKLTSYHRKAIVASIMNDLPGLDTTARRIRAQKLLASAMSPEVKRLYNKNPDAVATSYVNQTTYGTDNNYLRTGGMKPEVVEKVLHPLMLEQAAYRQMKDRVTAAIAGCSTRKQLIDTYPEFSKYAPTEAGGVSQNLPAVANLIADLVTAGWKQTISKGASK